MDLSYEIDVKWEQGENQPQGVELRLNLLLANQGEDLIKN
jgi:DNA-binding transcriptional regulator YiaG